MTALRNSILIYLTLISSVSFCKGQFTDAEKKEMLDKHNNGRRLQDAADMNELVSGILCVRNLMIVGPSAGDSRFYKLPPVIQMHFGAFNGISEGRVLLVKYRAAPFRSVSIHLIHEFKHPMILIKMPAVVFADDH
jgi:hypothetical protein